ncbi:hypothetical protein ISS05_05385 [Candidatus Woesearchaeota archaeon]|nr:hypothetical protein [Candidatus Woesearchaeota archaeon]
MESEKVKELAETLKNQGLAASMYEAVEKAKLIIGDEEKIEKTEEQKEKLNQEQQKKVEEQKYEKKGFFEKIKDKTMHNHPKDAERFQQPDYNISREEITVNELMKDLGVNPDEVKEIEKERVEEKAKILKEEIRDQEMKEEQNILNSPGSKDNDSEEKVRELKEKIRSIKEEAEALEEER